MKANPAAPPVENAIMTPVFVPELTVFEDPTGLLTFEEIESGEGELEFRPVRESSNYGFSDSVFWVRFRVPPHAVLPEQTYLFLGQPLHSRVELFVVSSGQMRSFTAGLDLPFDERPVPHRNPIFPLNLKSVEITDVYLRIESINQIDLGLELLGDSELERRLRNDHLFMGAYYGILLVIFVYNLFLYRGLRDRDYLLYAAYILSFGLLVGSLEGIAFEFLWPGLPQMNAYAIPVFNGLAIFFVVQFSRSFLSTPRKSPGIDRAMIGLMAAAVLHLLSPLVLPPALAVQPGSLLAILMVLVCLAAGIRESLRGHRPALYYLMAFSAFMAGTFVYSLQVEGLIPASALSRRGVLFGSALEMILISVALAARIQLLREELETFTDRLERRVKDRTVQLRQALNQLRRKNKQLNHEAFHDPLTGLPNRELVLNRLKKLFSRTVRDPELQFAVLFVDLDHFKLINDSLGHLNGDVLLKELARRLKQVVRPNDTVGRFGGDEFIVLLDELEFLSQAEMIGQRIQENLRQPFRLEDKEVSITASIGISGNHWGTAASAEAFLREADTAMYQAKSLGRDRIVYFDQKMQEKSTRSLGLRNDLRSARENEEFLLYYQPIFALPDARVAGFEALIRWRHPQRGLVLPGEFMPITEQNGQIQAIGEWVFRQTLARLDQWRARYPDLYLSVNVSARQFAERDFFEKLSDLRAEHPAAASGMMLEITEQTIMLLRDRNPSTYRELARGDMRIALDGFGSGVSPLGFLNDLPVSQIKIDRHLIAGLSENPRTRRLAHAIISLARELELPVVATCVETEEQWRILQEFECDFIQGYFTGYPVDVELAEELLAASPLAIQARLGSV